MAVFGMVVVAGCKQEEQHEPVIDDGRQALQLPAAEREAVLAEMRQMLESVNGILQGVVANDMPAIEKAARASGVATAVDQHLDEHLPEQFVHMGMEAHQNFDKLADQMGTGGTREDAITALATLSNNCVACHRTYRVAVPR